MKRYLCWDQSLIEQQTGVQTVMHKPEKRNVALVCDDEWEGACNGYATVLRVGDHYRMYYRATVLRHRADGVKSPYTSVICVAESRDGITFRKPTLGLYTFNGSRENNIVYATENLKRDTFSILYDDAPDCPAEERFKALTERREPNGPRLVYLASADGYRFTEQYELDVRGTMDSYNALFRDPRTGLYHLYYRAFHDADGTDHFSFEGVDLVRSIRDVRHATSPDFRNWTAHGRITFEAGQADVPLYTNQIAPYYRDPDTLIGFPTRYTDRADEPQSFAHMPLADYRAAITAHFGREGTALTDCLIMTSMDGQRFNRRDEAFFSPGPENRFNWWYGDCYLGYGMQETAAEEPGAPCEISLYTGEGYRIKSVSFRRYTVRQDGFFSWYAPWAGGEVLTHPIVPNGERLELNFSTSAAGALSVALCNEAGEILPGYESGPLFGNSTARTVDFQAPLTALCGQPVRLRLTLRDAHLYSFAWI